MIQAAIFDLDGTLYDYETAHAAALRALAAFAGEALGLTPERFHALHQQMFDLQKARSGRCAAIHSRLLRFQLMLEHLGRPIALAPVMERLYWDTLLAVMAPLPGAGETLDRLRAAGIRVGVGTNMTAGWQFAKLQRLDLLRRLDFLVTSEEAGLEKPEPKFFGLCAQKAGCEPGACAFVGDSLRSDALGAQGAGMRGVWLRGETAAEAPAGITTISALTELPELLIQP